MARELTVATLRELLADYPDDAVVRLMTQPSWPFEHTIEGIVASGALVDDDDLRVDVDFEGNANPERVFLVEGRQTCYGRRAAWDACYRD